MRGARVTVERMYELLTKCQLKVRDCRLQKIDEIEIDMHLLRLKKCLMFNSISADGDALELCHKGIRQLYDQISDLCNQGDDAVEITQYNSRVQELIEAVKRLCE